MNRPMVLLFVSVLLITQVAFGWSTKEHVMITRIAVRDLLASDATPPEMKAWLIEAQPQLGTLEQERDYLMLGHMGVYPRAVDGLAFWAVMPDLIADSADGKQRKVAPFDVPEGLLHFIDVEYFMPNEADRNFAADLSHRPSITDIPRDMKDPRWQKAGMLPFRVENCFNELTAALKAGKLVDKPGQFPRDEHATRYAGMLAHYAADNCMPLHATMDYQCYSFFPTVEKSKRPKVHFDMEFRLTDDDANDYPELRAEFWNVFVAAIPGNKQLAIKDDVWASSLTCSLFAYGANPMIGKAAQKAHLDAAGNLKAFDADAFFHFRGRIDGWGDDELSILQVKALMMGKAVRWTESLWLESWRNAHAR